MSGIKIPVQAQFDNASMQDAIQGFLAQINQLGSAVAAANKIKFNPIGSATIDDAKKLAAAYKSLLQVSPGLNKRVKATGQEKTDFTSLDWSKLYADSASRAQQMRKSYEYVVGNRFQAMDAPELPGGAPPAAPGGGGSQPPGGGGSGGGDGPSSPWRDAGKQVIGAGVNAVPGGRAVAGAVSAGQSGGLGAGVASLLGNVGAMFVGKAVSAVMEKVGQAEQDLIGYDTLKRTLGDVNVSFGTLKESLKNAARANDMTFEESLRLGAQFTKLSGISKEHYGTLQAEVENSGGFARSFGLDPSQSNAFFAMMRANKVTDSPQESRDLALMVAEGVAKAGAFAKMDDVLDAISGFTAQQTRNSLNVSNVAGYTEMLTGLTGSGRAGLDPAGAAALLGRVNSSIASGGSAGEAGQNFLYSALGTSQGLNPIQAKILQEQGAFGTGAGTFGKGSMYAEFAKKYGIATPAGAAESETTNLELIKGKLEKVYKDKPELMVDAMANLFGTNLSQSMALATIDGKELGGLSARLKRNGISVNDVNATGISRISQIEADKSLSESEKDKLIKEAAGQNQETTDGSRTRASINGVERAVVDMAEKLVTPLNMIREGVMFMAGEGKKSQRQILEDMAGIESNDKKDQIKRAYAVKLQAQQEIIDKAEGSGANVDIDKVRHAYRDKPEIMEQRIKDATDAKSRRDTALAEIDRLSKERAAAMEAEDVVLKGKIEGIRNPNPVNPAERVGTERGRYTNTSRGPSATASEADGSGKSFGSLSRLERAQAFEADAEVEKLTPEQRKLALSIYQQESGGGGNTATSVNGAMGHMQMLPATFKAYADKDWDINNPEHNRRAAMRYIKDLHGKAGGNSRTAAGAYYGGEKAINPDGSLKLFRNLKRPSDPTTHEYADEVVGRMSKAPDRSAVTKPDAVERRPLPDLPPAPAKPGAAAVAATPPVERQAIPAAPAAEKRATAPTERVTPVPATPSAEPERRVGAAGPSQFEFAHTITVQNPAGDPLGAPINTRTRAPMPSGAYA